MALLCGTEGLGTMAGGPKQLHHYTEKDGTSAISAAESFGRPQQDAENAVLNWHTGTCRFQKPILLSRSLLLTGKY